MSAIKIIVMERSIRLSTQAKVLTMWTSLTESPEVFKFQKSALPRYFAYRLRTVVIGKNLQERGGQERGQGGTPPA